MFIDVALVPLVVFWAEVGPPGAVPRMLDELAIIQRSGESVDRRQAVVYSLLAALSASVGGVGLWWAVTAAVRGRLTVGDVSMFVAALSAASTALAGTVSNTAIGYQAVLMFRSSADIVAAGSMIYLLVWRSGGVPGVHGRAAGAAGPEQDADRAGRGRAGDRSQAPVGAEAAVLPLRVAMGP